METRRVKDIIKVENKRVFGLFGMQYVSARNAIFAPSSSSILRSKFAVLIISIALSSASASSSKMISRRL
jgi:hypothetical protein